MQRKRESLHTESILNILAFFKKPLKVSGLLALFILIVASSYFREVIFNTRESGYEIPAQITFDFDLDGIESNNIYVKKSSSDKQGTTVDPKSNTISIIYEYPGFYKARLLVDNKTVKSSDVFIKTNGWLATTTKDNFIKYHNQALITNHNEISIPEKWSDRNAFDKVTYHYFDQINPISGLDFVLEAELKTIQPKDFYQCNYVQVEIVGSNSSSLIPVTLSACSIDLPVTIAGHENFTRSTLNKYLAANNNSEWQNFKLVVHGGTAQFIINNQKQLTLPVKSSMGQIVGLRFHFDGNGAIKNVNLTDTQEVTYIDTFQP